MYLATTTRQQPTRTKGYQGEARKALSTAKATMPTMYHQYHYRRSWLIRTTLPNIENEGLRLTDNNREQQSQASPSQRPEQEHTGTFSHSTPFNSFGSDTCSCVARISIPNRCHQAQNRARVTVFRTCVFKSKTQRVYAVAYLSGSTWVCLKMLG